MIAKSRTSDREYIIIMIGHTVSRDQKTKVVEKKPIMERGIEKLRLDVT